MTIRKHKDRIVKTTALLGLFLLIFGLSYALFTVTLNGTKKVKIKTGKLELQLLDKNDQDITEENAGYLIELENQVPTAEEDALKQEGIVFKVKNTGNISAKYEIYVDDVALESGEERLMDNYVAYNITKDGYFCDEDMLGWKNHQKEDPIVKGTIRPNQTVVYNLKLWIDKDTGSSEMNKVFLKTLRLEGVQTTVEFEDGTLAAKLYDNSDKQTVTTPISSKFDSSRMKKH